MFSNLFLAISFLILILIISGLSACGEGDEDDVSNLSAAALGTLCGPRFELTGGAICSSGGVCISDLVQGTAKSNGAGSYNFFRIDKMCTKACNSDLECKDISFTKANNVNVVSEYWSCNSVSSGAFCGVSVVAPGGGGDLCSGCGGAFCSGRCIGCPQC